MAEVFGFNKQDADNLLRVIGGSASEVSFLANDPGIIGIFGFELTSSFTRLSPGAPWVANCVAVDALFTRTLSSTATVIDPLGAFVSLPVGHRGLAIRFANFLIAVQAACPQA